jgi:hypothetical protein
MLVPKVAFEYCGEFNTSLRCTQDYDMWYRMIKKFKFIHLKDVLSMTRVHAGQDTQSNPRAVSEGNTLWVSMVANLSYEEKIATEGSLVKFYLEMIKFLRQTPYSDALEYCRSKLEESVQLSETYENYSDSLSVVIRTYESLYEENEKKASSYYFENIVKRSVSENRTNFAAKVVNNLLIGNSVGLKNKDIENYYLVKLNSSEKPRIMFCSGQWLTGGMERVMSVLFEQLKDDYDIFLLTAYDGKEGKIRIPKHVTHIRMSVEYFWSGFDYRALSHALILNIDVVIGFMNLFSGQLDFYEICKGTRIKTIASNHEIYFYPYSYPKLFYVIPKRINAYKDVEAALWLTNFSAAAFDQLV